MRIKENLDENGKISQFFTKGILVNIKVYACASFIPLWLCRSGLHAVTLLDDGLQEKD